MSKKVIRPKVVIMDEVSPITQEEAQEFSEEEKGDIIEDTLDQAARWQIANRAMDCLILGLQMLTGESEDEIAISIDDRVNKVK
jgi:hypothetical protein